MSAPARGPDSAPLLRPNAFLASALRQVDLPEAGAAVDVGCGSGRDAVFLAQTLGDTWETIGVDNHKGALGAGAAINLADSDGYSPLLLSGHFGAPEFMSVLLDASAEVDQRADNGWTPLAQAASDGRLRCVELLQTRLQWSEKRVAEFLCRDGSV